MKYTVRLEITLQAESETKAHNAVVKFLLTNLARDVDWKVKETVLSDDDPSPGASEATGEE